MPQNKKVIWTEADRARHRAVREKFKDRPTIEELVARGDLTGQPMTHGLHLELRALLHDLKQVRESAGVSLADLAEKSGIDKAALSRLENGVQANPTLETLARYAAALGKQIRLTAVDE